MLPKAYEPKKHEDHIYQRWEDSGFFNPDKCEEAGLCTSGDTFSIVLPPPNVTGTLHIGHAVMLAVEDVMTRYHRMKGDKTLWLPGTDHAAIATQEKVERLLWEEGKTTRHDLGRDKFIERVEKFAQDSHDRIIHQTKKMGSSLDWSREAYTLDDQRNLAVRTAFKEMYDADLIYRGDRIVNWDPKMQSNVSDIEVVRQEEKAPFYYFQYGPFEIGTSRPETKFGDKYVVMHPDDKRYKKYKHGDTFDCEWINGQITATIIKDEAVDPEFGSGVMTITPWHDTTDFEIAERHQLDKEQIIDLEGKLLPIAGEFAGLEIEKARPKIVKKLKEKGLLTKVDKNYIHQLATNSRGGGVIEPQIMKQWFVDVNKKFKAKTDKLKTIKKGQEISLKELMQKVVKEKQVEIIPRRFEKIYFHWIDNLRDWCISRQLWYGHQIPAWYKNDQVQVGIEAPGGDGWEQDPDTLDTWFSSGLWTFSTLGWPQKTDDLNNFHPTSVLETGYDIIFFWVARMILMSGYLIGDIPFEKVYLHGLVRDEKGRKMSKSLHNIIDPLDVCQKYGTDAVRLSLLIGATPGNDSRLSEEKIAGFRNFANKLWNISRFMLMNIDQPRKDLDKPKTTSAIDQWIIHKLEQVTFEVSKDLEAYQFSSAGEKLRDFTWGELADWYLEMAKVEGNKSELLNYLLNTVLKLWHPFMPFVTETIWQEVYSQEAMLMIEPFPAAKKQKENEVTSFVDQALRSLITGIRSLRADYKIEPAKRLNAIIKTNDVDLLEANSEVIKGLARLDSLEIGSDLKKPTESIGFVQGKAEVFIDVVGVVDLAKEKDRLKQEISEIEQYHKSVEKKLANKEFVANAPKAVVAKEKEKVAEAQNKIEKLKSQLANL